MHTRIEMQYMDAMIRASSHLERIANALEAKEAKETKETDYDIDYSDEFRKYSVGDILKIDGCYVLEQLTLKELTEVGFELCRQQQIVQITKVPPVGSTDEVDYEIIFNGPDIILD
mgnify:CR=1 FL=1